MSGGGDWGELMEKGVVKIVSQIILMTLASPLN